MKVLSLGALLLAATIARSAVLVQHDYDALGDHVIALPLRSGEHLTQSFTAPDTSASATAIRLKVQRLGEPGPLHYSIGARLGSGEIATGDIAAALVQPYFEHFISLPVRDKSLRPGVKYFVQVNLSSSNTGYYQVYGTKSGEEGPINRDYGAVTPTYSGGQSYDASDRLINDTELAFQLVGPDPDSVHTEEPFEFISGLIAPVRYKRARYVGPTSHRADEVLLDNSWSLQISPSAGIAARTGAAEFERFMNDEIAVKLAKNGPKRIRVMTVSESPSYRSRLSKSEAFVLDTKRNEITIVGYDDRGMMRGIYYLQDILDLRQAPLLTIGVTVRVPRYNPRITCAPFLAGQELDPYSDPYTDGLLSKMSHAGYDAIWVWGKLYQLGNSTVFPELGGESSVRLARLRAIIERAAKYGIDVYAYVTLDPLPASFFDRHPDARGVPYALNQFYGSPGFVLCTSSHVVQKYLEEATASIFRDAPGLRGAVMIPYGEGLFTCRTRGANTCKRCANRRLEDVLAELVNTIRRGALEGNPKAEVATWTYTWPESDPSRAAFIAKLPSDIIWLATFEKEAVVERDGVHDYAYDYSISSLGPSENLRLQLPLIMKSGMPLWIKTESMISEEFIQTPYIPVYQRWEERYRRLAQFPRVTGLFMNWNHYGFMPSRVSELVKWFTSDPMPSGDKLLHQIALRDFGPNAADRVVEAWQTFSDSFTVFPFSDGATRSGPLQKGPAHPFFWDADYRPLASARRQFYNNLDWTKPWDVAIVTKYYSAVEQQWAKATELLRDATAHVDADHRLEAEQEVGIAEMQLSCLRTALNLIRFYELRFQLEQASDPDAVLRQMTHVLEEEKTNSLRGLEVAKRDSRLGYANGGVGITNGGVRAGIFTATSISKKVAQIDQVLNEHIPKYHLERPSQ